MPKPKKQKTNKSAAKRFKLTGSGKLKRSKANKAHILTKKSPKRKRNLGKSTLVSKGETKVLKKVLHN